RLQGLDDQQTEGAVENVTLVGRHLLGGYTSKLLAVNWSDGRSCATALRRFATCSKAVGVPTEAMPRPHPTGHDPYCSRRASNGSAIPARKAGTNAAATPTPNNAAPAAANAMGSTALTSKRNDDSSRVRIAAPPMPATIPADTSIAPWPR